MPIIEFHCTQCSESYEKILPFYDVTPDAEADCPKCNTTNKRVLFSTTLQPHLYGDGFHKPSPTKRHSYSKINSWGNSTKPPRR